MNIFVLFKIMWFASSCVRRRMDGAEKNMEIFVQLLHMKNLVPSFEILDLILHI